MIGLIQKRKYKDGNKNNGLSGLCSTAVAQGIGASIFTPLIIPKKKYFVLINWGLTKIPWIQSYLAKHSETVVINPPEAVLNASNKLLSFKLFDECGVSCPKWTDDIEVAKSWFSEKEGTIVFCRTLVSSYQGKGIVIATSPDQLVPAKLYTLRFPKKWEYRVHVCMDNIIRIQQKKRLSDEKLAERGITKTDGLIRSYNNGYIFSTELTHATDSEVVKELCNQAIKAVKSLGLHFGAVDILVTATGKVKVLEVNTSPGIEGGTVDAYINFFKEG